MEHSARPLGIARGRWALAILFCLLTLSGCSRLTWENLEPHYDSNSSPLKVTWRLLYPPLSSIYGTNDGKLLWAVGHNGTIVHSSDGENWSAQRSGTQNNLYSIYGTSDGRLLWAVGESGTIVHNSDREQWSAQRSGTTNDLNLIYGTSDGRLLWAVGENGTIVHSSDGEHWSAQGSGTENTLNSICGTSDGRLLWAVGENGRIVHSSDGEHWSAQRSHTRSDLKLIYGTSDGRLLWAVGQNGTIVHSSDGEHWSAQRSGTRSDLNLIYGTSDGRSLWVVGDDGTILHSSDEKHWSAQRSGTTDNLLWIYGTADGRSLWVVGEDGTILHSSDGEHWSAQRSGARNYLFSVYGTSDGRSLWAVGYNGTILHSSDGEHWGTQTTGTPDNLFSIYGTSDGRSLWAVGYNRTILHSSDGEHWGAQRSGTRNDFRSIYGTSDGRSLWAVGYNGTIVHSSDGEHWSAQTTGIRNYLNLIYGTSDGRSLWAVGYNGTILHSSDGEHWSAQTSGTQNDLYSIYGTSDGRSLWAVGFDGTILHSSDREHWSAQISGTQNNLYSIYGTSDGRSLWAVGENGTILHSSDGEHWSAQTSGTQNNLYSIYGTSDGRSLWAVGENGTILRSLDGEHWAPQTSGTHNNLLSIYGTSDGRSLWAVGENGTILRGSTIGRYPYIAEARIAGQGVVGTRLEWQVTCPEGDNANASVEVSGRSYRHRSDPSRDTLLTQQGQPRSDSCGFHQMKFDPDIVDVRPGESAYFDITFMTSRLTQHYTFNGVYEPWKWFRDYWPWLAAITLILSVVTTLFGLLHVKPLWIIYIYRALKLAQIDKLSIPGLGPHLRFALKVFTLLPYFVAHPRVLGAWVNANRGKLAAAWDPNTPPENPQGGSHANTLYIPLPMRVGNSNSGEIIHEPNASWVATLFSGPRAVVEIVGPGGAGKTTFARQVGRWALDSGRPGRFPGHPMLPVWIDEELDSGDHTLVKAVKAKLAALLPDEEIEGDILNALLKKQRMVVIVDRLSERSGVTQALISSIYTSARVEALVITSRTQVRPIGSEPVFLYPQPLNESNLIKFMLALIDDWAQHSPVPRGSGNMPLDTLSEGALSDPESQLDLAKRLTLLFRSAGGEGHEERAILPLTVRLFVEEAIRILNLGRSLDELPVSLPDVYLRYLERVNPEAPTAKNFMTNEDFLRAGMVLAKLALGDDFIPKEFFKDDARNALKQSGWTEQTKTDPIQRMVDNGILLEKTVVGHVRLRFVLDPVAENLAASAYVRECRGNVRCLDELSSNAHVSPGFQAAVNLARRAWGSE